MLYSSCSSPRHDSQKQMIRNRKLLHAKGYQSIRDNQKYQLFSNSVQLIFDWLSPNVRNITCHFLIFQLQNSHAHTHTHREVRKNGVFIHFFCNFSSFHINNNKNCNENILSCTECCKQFGLDCSEITYFELVEKLCWFDFKWLARTKSSTLVSHNLSIVDCGEKHPTACVEGHKRISIQEYQMKWMKRVIGVTHFDPL